MTTLSWLRSQELPTGGILAWPGDVAYPEISGYLIPTLYDYGEFNYAERVANWLLTVQDATGAFPARDGSLHTFDSAACVEGLERACKESGAVVYQQAADKARAWLGDHLREDRRYWTGPAKNAHRQYTLRINGLLGIDPGEYKISGSDRVHYIAYALEGYLSLGYRDEVRGTLEAMPEKPDGLMPFSLDNWQPDNRDDVCATAQIAILKHKVGLDARRQVEAVRRNLSPDGAVPQSSGSALFISWGAKFALDMERLCTR